MKISRKELKYRLRYERKTGFWFWLRPTAKRVLKGARAGNICTSGHRQITVHGRTYMAHILAWFYVLGEWPPRDIDHEDNNPDNNVWTNLRLATEGQNISNSKRRKDNKSGFKGVSWRRAAQKWEVSIAHNKKKIFLGLHDDPKIAHAAYCVVAIRLKGAFARLV